MNRTSALAQRYGAVLQMYVSTGGEEALEEAQDIGREALESGTGPLVLFSMHRDVVQQLPPQPVEGDEFVSRITTVFIETLAPFQMSAGSFDQAQARTRSFARSCTRRERGSISSSRPPTRGGQRGPQAQHRQRRRSRSRRYRAGFAGRRSLFRHQPQDRRRHRAHPGGGTQASRRRDSRRRRSGDDCVCSESVCSVPSWKNPIRSSSPTSSDDVRDAIARLRLLLIGLSPPELDRGGLGSAVRSALERLGAELQIDYSSTTDSSRAWLGVADDRVPHRSGGARRRTKHAGATDVPIVFEPHPGGMRMSVTNDGVGFEVDETLAVARPGTSA